MRAKRVSGEILADNPLAHRWGHLSIGVGGASNSHPSPAPGGRPKTAHTYGQKVNRE